MAPKMLDVGMVALVSGAIVRCGKRHDGYIVWRNRLEMVPPRPLLMR